MRHQFKRGGKCRVEQVCFVGVVTESVCGTCLVVSRNLRIVIMSLLKQETKRQIRALLLSAPKGLTVLGIQDDFQIMLGKTLPFRELGYPTAEELLRDFPDVVRVSCVGEEVMLRGISDTSTEHIERMVSRQKVSSKKTKHRRHNAHLKRKGAPPTAPDPACPGRSKLPSPSPRPRSRTGDRTFRSNYQYRSYLPPWAWPRSYGPTTTYTAGNLPDTWRTYSEYDRLTTRTKQPTRPMAMKEIDIAPIVHHQNTPCSVTVNDRDTAGDFGYYVGEQLGFLPDTEAKELLKLDIQRLLMSARVAEMMKPNSKMAERQRVRPPLTVPLLPVPSEQLPLPRPWLQLRCT